MSYCVISNSFGMINLIPKAGDGSHFPLFQSFATLNPVLGSSDEAPITTLSSYSTRHTKLIPSECSTPITSGSSMNNLAFDFLDC